MNRTFTNCKNFQTWGMASGCAPYYNTCKEGTSNTKMVRDFENDSFEIFAVNDIEKDEELLHVSIFYVFLLILLPLGSYS